MTRDEAIVAVRDALGMKDFCLTEPRSLVDALDALVALGLLKLDGVLPQSHLDAPMPPVKPPRRDPWNAVKLYLDDIGVKWDQAAAGRIVLHRLLTAAEREKIDGIRPISMLICEPPARCEPPPEHRQKPHHWLVGKSGELVPADFYSASNQWQMIGDPDWYSLSEMTEYGWRYVAPCEEPRRG